MFPVDSELVLASQGTSRVLTPSSCKSPPVGNHAASVLWAPVSSTKSPLTRVFQLPPPLFFLWKYFLWIGTWLCPAQFL